MLLHKLRANSGKIAKERILAKADTYDKDMFRFAYHPDLVYNVKYNYINWHNVNPLQDVDKILLSDILEGKYKGQALRDAIDNHCKMHGDLVKLIVNKDLDCGVMPLTINKVFGRGFIPLFEVQLAEEDKIENVSLPVWGQIKYNGVRVLAHITPEGVSFRTRNGKWFKYPGLAERLSKVSDYYKNQGIIIDGELTIGTSAGTNHTNISGRVNSAIKGTPIQDVGNIIFNVFDILPIGEFYEAFCETSYAQRFGALENFITILYNNLSTDEAKSVVLAHTYNFTSHEEIEKAYEEVLGQGFEGLILKSPNHKYTFKRTKDWVKLKNTSTVDLKCKAIQEGEGKYEGQIGALLCEGICEGRHVTVKVGSGLKDHHRAKPVEDYLEETIEIKYNSLIQDKTTGMWSLFLPRFVVVRGDK